MIHSQPPYRRAAQIAYRLGYQAAAESRPRTANPYRPRGLARELWDRGYLDADRSLARPGDLPNRVS